MQITVVGAGYVGLSLATLLGQKHEVIVLDIDEEKVAKVNSRISPVQDVYLEKFFAERKLNLTEIFWEKRLTSKEHLDFLIG